jgi:uncharacterized pyridoxamine 5'-phosphate oxidase family protein
MSEIDEVVTFLRSSSAFHIATVDATGRPRNRPFNVTFECKGHLVFGTGSPKKVYAELVNTPYIEISAFNPSNFSWVRIHGEVKWFDDIEAKNKVFEVMPHLTNVYQSPDNPILKMFYIVGQADFYQQTIPPNPGPSKSIQIN